jgi:hypothetical protein
MKINFSSRPWNFLSIHKTTLALHSSPYKDLEPSNWIPRGKGGVAGRNSGEPVTLSAGEGVEEG